jgi:hypothetical protein
MQTYDLAIAHDWEYDTDFIQLIVNAARKQGLSCYTFDQQNLQQTLHDLENGLLAFRFLFDRASDTSPEFRSIQDILKKENIGIIDPVEKLRWASDKATMHLEFISNGLHTPFTVILGPYDESHEVRLSVQELHRLGRPFVIKPANTTGGGIGVVEGAESLQDVLEARKEFQSDKYLLQEKIAPLQMDGKRFWFRGFYSCGLVQCCWWDDQFHLYSKLHKQEMKRYKLSPLFKIVEKIAAISQLSFFSTEISLSEEGKFVVIDYVNESCDMRLKSRYADGVVDIIVINVADKIVAYIKRKLRPRKFFF